MIKLKRYSNEPLLKPIKEHNWEKSAVFNCGVYYDGELIHMLYRASDTWDKSKFISCFGYAVSKDGIDFMRFDKPVMVGDNEQEKRGVEDPRITKLDNTFYIVYTGYSGNDTKICYATTNNFITFKKHGVLIGDVDNKDGGLFPEKINGKYVLLHRRMPNIWISFSDDLKNWTDHQIIMEVVPDSWEEYKIGISGPPLKTEFGWLLFYHGVDNQKVYRQGIALLDLNDPRKVIKRQKEPILEPELSWEKEGWVNNVVFCCQVIEKDDQYLMYYGGADTVIGLATISKEEIDKFATS